MTPTRADDHCPAHSIYNAGCDPCFDEWLANAEIRTQGYEAICNDIDTVLESLVAPEFAREWERLPRGERSTAEYWWWRGRQAGLDEGRKMLNGDLVEMGRMVKGRLA